MDYPIPLSTDYRDNLDFNALDASREFELLGVRQEAIESMLRGDLSPDDLLDIMESQEIDPMEYARAVADSLEFVIKQGTEITGWPSNIS